LAVQTDRHTIRLEMIAKTQERATLDTILDIFRWICSAPFILCGWLAVGFIAGALARFIMRVEDKPFWSDMILGLLGAGVGILIAGALNFETGDQSGLQEILTSIIIATIGAAILILLARVITGEKHSSRRRR